MRPMKLEWYSRKHEIFGNELFTNIPGINIDEKTPAHYTIRADNGMTDCFVITWWCGNRGYYIGRENSIEKAKELAQKTFNDMVFSLFEKDEK